MSKWSEQRHEWINSSREELLIKAQEYQDEIIKAIKDEFAPSLETEGGKIKFTTKNFALLAKLDKILRDIAALKGDELAQWFVKQLMSNASMNLKYFNEIVPDKAPINQKAYRRAMSTMLYKFGYDGRAFINGGFLTDLGAIEEPIRKIKAEAVKAISVGKDYREFLKDQDTYIRGGEKTGIIEKHMRTNAYDAFQQVDRQLSNQMSIAIGLNYALFSSGIMETTREWCEKNQGKVFTRKQIEKWKDEDWDGKPATNYDPFTDVGGYNCTHTLDWISDETALKLLKKQK